LAVPGKKAVILGNLAESRGGNSGSGDFVYVNQFVISIFNLFLFFDKKLDMTERKKRYFFRKSCHFPQNRAKTLTFSQK
jgi:hypothetical protein